ncbi:phosphotransferase [Dermacoccaceae bacterium W4C1]
MSTDQQPGGQTEIGRLFVITGVQAAGKTTVGEALAATLNKSVFIDGDTVGNMVVSGSAPMTDPASPEAIEQLLFRYAGALVLADTYRAAGFDAVVTDNVFGEFMEDYLEIAAPETLHLVMLHPSVAQVQAREDGRRKNAYRDGITVQGLWDQVEHHTPRIGLWLDTSEMTVSDVVLEIIRRQHEAIVETA